MPVREGEFYHTHKACNRSFEQERPNDWAWEELGAFVLQIGFNLDMWSVAEARLMHQDTHSSKRGPRIKLPRSERMGRMARRFQILKRDDYRCQICGRSSVDGARLEVDHKHPRAHGGDDSYDNLWTLCFDCNRGKGTQAL